MLRFGILTVSTTCSKHPKMDIAGPTLEREILKSFPECQITFKKIVCDNKRQIVNVLTAVVDVDVCDIIFTVGGTGFAPSDVTPEATRCVIEKEAPGISHAILSKSLAVTEMAMLSRPVCGIKNQTIVINFPGSTKAALECFGFIKSGLPHAVALLKEDNIRVKETHEQIQSHHIDILPEFGESKVKIKAGVSRSRKSQYPMLEVDQAKTVIFEYVPVFKETEEIYIEEALLRVLAEDIRAKNPVPAFPASIKDGYAVKVSDGVMLRKVRSVAAAGDYPELKELQAGEVIRISTGAPVPPWADAVVQVEDTTLIETSDCGEEEKTIQINVEPKLGQDIRQIGSDIQENTLVLENHHSISAAYIGVLAMLGFNKVKVVRRPSVGIISTGNELQHPKETLKLGQIHDSNKITLLSLLKSYGYNASDCGIARDLPNNVKSTLEKAFKENDFIVSSGGVSMGEYDLLKQVLIEDFGAVIHFGRVNMKPGKPTVFATLDYKGNKKVVFALPGNPVSCCVTCLLFVIPALKRMEDDKLYRGWPTVTTTMQTTLINRDTRPEFVRLSISNSHNNGQLVAISTGKQISSRLNSMVNANGLLLVPGHTTYEAGSVQSAYLFGPLF